MHEHCTSYYDVIVSALQFLSTKTTDFLCENIHTCIYDMHVHFCNETFILLQ